MSSRFAANAYASRMISSECAGRFDAGIGGHFGSHRMSAASGTTFLGLSAKRRTIALNVAATAAIQTAVRLRLGVLLGIVVSVLRNSDLSAKRFVSFDLLNRLRLVVAHLG